MSKSKITLAALDILVAAYRAGAGARQVECDKAERELTKEVADVVAVHVQRFAEKHRLGKISSVGQVYLNFGRAEINEVENISVTFGPLDAEVTVPVKIPAAQRRRLNERLAKVNAMRLELRRHPSEGNVPGWRRAAFRKLLERNPGLAEKIATLAEKAAKAEQTR